jgi:hypothetical protein
MGYFVYPFDVRINEKVMTGIDGVSVTQNLQYFHNRIAVGRTLSLYRGIPHVGRNLPDLIFGSLTYTGLIIEREGYS